MLQVHNYNTRSKFIDITNASTTNNLFIPIARTTHYGLNQLKVLGPKIWNELPPKLRNSNYIARFNKDLKNHLIKAYL